MRQLGWMAAVAATGALGLAARTGFCADKSWPEPKVIEQRSSSPLVIEGSEGAPGVEEWLTRPLELPKRDEESDAGSLELRTYSWLTAAGILTGIPERGLAIEIVGKLAQPEAVQQSKP
jgi:hypothetical protein